MTLWLTMQPNGATQLADEPNVASLFRGVPDRVRAPADLGGGELRILSATSDDCPCNGGHRATIWILDEPTGIRVARCERQRMFLWFREGSR